MSVGELSPQDLVGSRADRPDPSRLARLRGDYTARELGLAAVFLVPSLVVFVAFFFYPLVRSVYLSFHGTDIIGGPGSYVGLAQYKQLVTSPEFRHVLLVTAAFTLLTVLPGILIGLLLALALQARVRGVTAFRTLMATPFAFSVATASVIFAVLYNPAVGVLNSLLGYLNVSPVAWLTSSATALPSVAALTVWLQLGYNLLVLSAGLQAIPEDIYEAARLDGARGWATTLRITLPLLTPSLFFLVIVSTINSLQTFGQIFILTRGGPVGSTTTLVYSLYQNAFAFGSSNFGLASAQAVVLFVIVASITAVQFGVLQRRVFYQ
ncbi:MAG: sugar ABC transporter permease [Actinomycetota bacterium]|nr:sugar ABC transporter permease [Actinomycetota bacterium]